MHQTKTLRGWRRAGVVAGSLAVLAAGAGGVATQAFADPGSDNPGSEQKPTDQPRVQQPKKEQQDPQVKGIGQPMEPNTDLVAGRDVAAALYGAVTELVPGKGSKFWGQGSYGDWQMSQGNLTFAPADGSAPGHVGAGIMSTSMFPGYVPSCEDELNAYDSCELSELADGSTLMTYAWNWGNGGTSWVAEHYVGDIRVTVEANNVGDRNGTVTRPDPVLTREQVTAIATEPWWSLEAPLDAPNTPDLPSYEESVVPTIQ